MKKIFTLLVVAMTAMSSMAANYTDSLTVTVNGQSVEQHATISVDKDQDGLLTFSLNNFILSMGGQEMGIGNIVIDKLQPMVAGTDTLLECSRGIYITEGNDREIMLIRITPHHALGAGGLQLAVQRSNAAVGSKNNIAII